MKCSRRSFVLGLGALAALPAPERDKYIPQLRTPSGGLVYRGQLHDSFLFEGPAETVAALTDRDLREMIELCCRATGIPPELYFGSRVTQDALPWGKGGVHAQG